MKSFIHIASVTHQRHKPVRSSFRYRLVLFEFDLGELAELDKRCWLFGLNRFSLFSLYERDYLHETQGSVEGKLRAFLESKGVQEGIERITLLTSPRYFGYVFNPVSFYFCYGRDHELLKIVAEVNNTFGEKHLYVVNPEQDISDGLLQHETPKEFHVSPFHDMKGNYQFRVADLSESLNVSVNILRDGVPTFRSCLSGVRKLYLRDSTILKIIARYPLTPWLTMPRILWQAAKLYYRKGLPVFRRPNPTSPNTVRNARPKWSEYIAMKLVFSVLRNIRFGSLTVHLPDRDSVTLIGKERVDPHVDLKVINYNFFLRLVTSNDVGFGESFTSGDFESSDLPKLLSVMIENRGCINPRKLRVGYLKRLLLFLEHRGRRNTLTGSKSNIKAHYDLSNRMFQLFLDESMTYSCAYFETPETDLVLAQKRKLQSIIQKADLKESDRVLEIGCGWGSFAIEAVQRTGCKMTCLTLSDEQQKYFERRVQSLGLEDKITILNCDYRNIEGKFDKIVSIEMLEAVGEEYIPEFFSCCERLLIPGGRLVVQVITMPHARMSEYRRNCDWIQKYIFPGCFVPSLEVVQSAASRASDFVVREVENIGLHYATTLSKWREKFLENEALIQAQGFGTDFIRMWEYYFGYCEAGFATQYLDTRQIVLERRK